MPALDRPALLRDPAHGPLPALLLGLTLLTGLVDAASILALDRVFVANMTGNVVFLGFAAAGAPGFSLAGSLVALAGFLVGAGAAGAVTRRRTPDRGTLLAAGCVAELVLVAAGAVVAAAAGGGPAAGRLAITALLAVALGAQNAVARRLAVPDLTTTVLTMTLTGIAADAKAGRSLTRRLLAVAAMVVGAVAGALLVLHASLAAGLGGAAAVLAVVTAGALAACRRPAGWRAWPS